MSMILLKSLCSKHVKGKVFGNPVKTEYERPLMDFKSLLPLKITQLLAYPLYANTLSAFALVF